MTGIPRAASADALKALGSLDAALLHQIDDHRVQLRFLTGRVDDPGQRGAMPPR
jgi:hypothetical protein